jgi:hypothetical protein
MAACPELRFVTGVYLHGLDSIVGKWKKEKEKEKEKRSKQDLIGPK